MSSLGPLPCRRLTPRRERTVAVELNRVLDRSEVGFYACDPEPGLQESRAVVVVHPGIQVRQALRVALGAFEPQALHGQLSRVVQVHPVRRLRQAAQP